MRQNSCPCPIHQYLRHRQGRANPTFDRHSQPPLQGCYHNRHRDFCLSATLALLRVLLLCRDLQIYPLRCHNTLFQGNKALNRSHNNSHGSYRIAHGENYKEKP